MLFSSAFANYLFNCLFRTIVFLLLPPEISRLGSPRLITWTRARHNWIPYGQDERGVAFSFPRMPRLEEVLKRTHQFCGDNTKRLWVHGYWKNTFYNESYFHKEYLVIYHMRPTSGENALKLSSDSIWKHWKSIFKRWKKNQISKCCFEKILSIFKKKCFKIKY